MPQLAWDGMRSQCREAQTVIPSRRSLMHRITSGVAVIALACLATLGVAAEPQFDQTVPRLVKFSGVVAGVHGTVGITFAFYADQASETPLWTETQRVTVDATGHFAVHLGASRPGGLPGELFVAADARWLGVRVEGQAEQPRVLLVSVLYALKAADAETVGGKPLSAFVLAGERTGVGADGLTYVDKRVLSSGLVGPAPGGAGSANYIGLFSDPTTLVNSVIYQTPAGSIGVNTTAPQAGFHAVSAASPVAYFDVYSNALGALPVVYRAARGTPASPSAVQTNDILGGLAVRGYGATGFTQGRGQVMFKAAENWTDSANGTYLQFTTTPIGSTVWTERMRISPNGYVGIGASTPQSPLDIRLADSHTYASFGADTNGGLFLIAAYPQIGFNLSYPASTGSWTRNATGPAGYLAFGQEAAGMFSFATLPSAAAGTTGIPVPRLVISNTGNVGIGTSSPTALLDVAGNTHLTGSLVTTGYVNSTSPSGSWFTSTSDNGTGLSGYANSGSNAWGVYGSSNTGVGVRGSGLVYGMEASSTSGIGILATNASASNATGQFENGNGAGEAIVAKVNTTTVMNVDSTGVHAGPGMTGTPIAYGSFSTVGVRLSGSGNLSCAWNAASTRYDCTISGAGFNPTDYIAIATPSNSSLPLFCTTSWDGGSLLIVRVFDQTFTSVQRQFHLVVFKP
jgi:hypothetical protein